MIEDANDINEFEQALRESFDAEDIKVGAVIQGMIVAIHGDVALVDVSGKSEAVLERSEIDELGTGDPVEVVVVSTGDEIRVSRRMALEAKLKEKLNEAVASGEPVEGKVMGRRKGGFDVTVSGVRGFCPISHISDIRTEDLDQFLGQTYTFKILEYEADGQRLVVSRAVLLREEKNKAREEAWSTLEAGAELDGRVRSITDFGAFVDLGGVDGLVHVTEIAHRRISHPREVLSDGQDVRVKILELDREKQRISLSIKALEEDPWKTVEERFPARGAFFGKIVRKADFGFFVELEPGLDGLLHLSQFPPGLDKNSPEFEVGQELRGWVRELDLGNRRIGLTLRQMPDRDPWERIEMRYQEGQTIEGKVENGTNFGVFVELEPGLSGLIPISEMGIEKDADPREAFKPGETLKLKVTSLDPGRQRISLSVKAVKRDLERQEYQKHMGSGSSEAAEPAITGFGAQLLAALEPAAQKSPPAKKPAKEPAKKTAKKSTDEVAEKAETRTTKTAKKTAAPKKSATSKKKTTAKKTTATEKAATPKKKTAPKKESAAKKTTAAKKPASMKKETAAKKTTAAKKPTAAKKATAAKKTAAKKPAKKEE